MPYVEVGHMRYTVDSAYIDQIHQLARKLEKLGSPPKPKAQINFKWGKIKNPNHNAIKRLGKKFLKKKSASFVKFLNKQCKCDRMDVINFGCKCGGE